jgi:hypothetical protein
MQPPVKPRVSVHEVIPGGAQVSRPEQRKRVQVEQTQAIPVVNGKKRVRVKG